MDNIEKIKELVENNNGVLLVKEAEKKLGKEKENLLQNQRKGLSKIQQFQKIQNIKWWDWTEEEITSKARVFLDKFEE